MRKLQLWQGLPVLFLASACIYNYTTINVGPDGGVTSTGTSGTTGGSGSGSTGSVSTGGNSTGSGSTGGAASSGGSTGGSSSNGGTGSCEPAGASWPLNCSSEEQIYLSRGLPSSSPIYDLSIVPLPGGSYLVGILLGQEGAGAQFVTVAPDGGVTDAGVQACVDANNDDCPNFALSLVSTGSGTPPTMVAGYFTPGSSGNFTDQIACWSPYNGTSPVDVDLSSVGASQLDVGVDLIKTAAVGAQIAVAVTDFEDGYDVLDLGPSGGGCPASSSATVPSAVGVGGLAITPSGVAGTPFLTAEALLSPDDLNLALVPGGATSTAAYGTNTSDHIYWPAVASDGTTFAALAGSDQDGVQLFAGSTTGLTPSVNGTTLSPATSFALSATSCGSGCALAGWVASSGGAETPTFAFVNSTGCADYVTLASFTDDTGLTALTAVASQPGSAVIAYTSSYAVSGGEEEGGRVNLRFCTP